MKRFDAIIVGAGQAGPSLAGRLTAAGMTVAVIERHLFGGTCVNTGCTPTKTLIASAHAAHVARRAADFGVVTGPVSVDMARVRARAAAVVSKSRDGVESWLGAMTGCTVLRGHARSMQVQTRGLLNQDGDRGFRTKAGEAICAARGCSSLTE